MNQAEFFLVGTPIGNLSDISPRAADTLRAVDFIAAEDTRNTLKLLNHLGIKKPLISYHEHNKRSRGPEILARLNDGQTGALVTDAGMPAISDPGEDLVKLLTENGIVVTAVAGPCAFVEGLILSGLPTGRFCFEGFLPAVKKERIKRLEALKNEERTLLFYEAPQRLIKTLEDLRDIFGGERPMALARELTKLHEQVLRGSIEQMLLHYTENTPRGEYVLIVGGGTKEAASAFWSAWDIPAHVAYYLQSGLSQMDAVKAVAKDRGVAKNQIYREYVQYKEEHHGI